MVIAEIGRKEAVVKYYKLIHGKNGKDDRLHVPTKAKRAERYSCEVKDDGTLVYIPQNNEAQQ